MIKKLLILALLLFFPATAHAKALILSQGGNFIDTWNQLAEGDTLDIGPGEFIVGYQDGQKGCSTFYPWDCQPKAMPSNVRVSGVAGKTKLIGVERIFRILTLNNTKNSILENLEITDSEACGEFHPTLPCPRSKYPYGKWAVTGIYLNNTEGVILRNLNIHGLGSRGVYASNYKNLTVDNVMIERNPIAGWDGDLDAKGGNDLSSGTNLFRNFKVRFNGCVEKADGSAAGCYGQGQSSGYGDGFTIDGGVDGAVFNLDHVDVSDNTSDGLDALYISKNAGINTVDSVFGGNGGNQFKSGALINTISNSKFYGDCAKWDGNPIAIPGILWCRAYGNTLSFELRRGAKIYIENSLIDKNQGDVLILTSGKDCDGAESLVLDGVVLQGGKEARGGDITAGIYDSGNDGEGGGPCKPKLTAVRSSFFNLKNNFCPPGNTCKAIAAPVIPKVKYSYKTVKKAVSYSLSPKAADQTFTIQIKYKDE